MTGSTHRLAGICTGILMMDMLQPLPAVSCCTVLLGAVAGSLLPDIDHSNSMISHKMGILSLPFYLGRFLVRSAAALLPSSLEKKVRSMAGHRGLTHSLFLPLCFKRIKFGNIRTGGMAERIVKVLFSVGGILLAVRFFK